MLFVGRCVRLCLYLCLFAPFVHVLLLYGNARFYDYHCLTLFFPVASNHT